MGARQVFVFAGVIALAPVRAADNGDTLRDSNEWNWRIGLSTALIRILPAGRDDPDMKTSDAPTVAWWLYPFHIGGHEKIIDGRYAILLPGVVLQNARHTAVNIAYGNSSLRYQSPEGSFPIFHTKEHWLLRTEYTRSTRPGVDPQRPRFGLRYGCALTLARGKALRESASTFSVSSGSSAVTVSTSLVRIQPTLQFGYRSRGLNAGIQLYMNLLAYVEGSVHQTGRRREGLQVIETDEVLLLKDLFFVNRLTQAGFLGSYFQLYLSVPFVGVGGKQARLHESPKSNASR